MNTTATSRTFNAAFLAYLAALLFAIHLFTYFIPIIRDATTASAPGVVELLVLLAVVGDLVLFPVVAALPAPSWARYAGYAWLTIDIVTEIMQLNAAPPLTFLSLRYGGHIPAGLWIVSVSWQNKLSTRIVGSLLALIIVTYSFTAFIPSMALLLISTPVLFPLWFILIGRILTQEHKQRLMNVAGSEQLRDIVKYGTE